MSPFGNLIARATAGHRPPTRHSRSRSKAVYPTTLRPSTSRSPATMFAADQLEAVDLGGNEVELTGPKSRSTIRDVDPVDPGGTLP